MSLSLKDVSAMDLWLTISRVRKIVRSDSSKGRKLEHIFLSLVEEVGELSRAIIIEKGLDNNSKEQLDESSKIEAVDVIISSLAMFFALDGDAFELESIIKKKLDKWESYSK